MKRKCRALILLIASYASMAAANPTEAAPGGRAPAIGSLCQMVNPVFPRAALDGLISGRVRAEATVEDGRVISVDILSGPEVYHEPVRQAMLQYRCPMAPSGTVKAVQEFDFQVR